jgi:hypothetical protein
MASSALREQAPNVSGVASKKRLECDQTLRASAEWRSACWGYRARPIGFLFAVSLAQYIRVSAFDDKTEHVLDLRHL